MATARNIKAAEKRLAAARAALLEAETAATSAGINVGVSTAAVHVEKKSSTTVFVGCKLPNGLELRMHELVHLDRPVQGGGIKSVPTYMPTSEAIVRLRGPAVPFGKIPNFPIIGNFGITEVSRSFWERWLEQNSKLTAVVSKQVFALSDELSAKSYAREHAADPSGLEPINPKGDLRTKEGSFQNPNLSDIEVDSDRDATAKVA